VKHILFVCTAAEIRASADQEPSRYAGAPVRSQVMTLAYRDTRSCLREGRCAVPAA
jgi:hypothetical protein